MSNASSYNCMPGENYHVEGRHGDILMELVGLDCLLNFFGLFNNNYSAMFYFALWVFCVVLDFNTNDYHHIGEKKKLLKVIHGNFNSSDNFCRLKPLPVIPKKPF